MVAELIAFEAVVCTLAVNQLDALPLTMPVPVRKCISSMHNEDSDTVAVEASMDSTHSEPVSVVHA